MPSGNTIRLPPGFTLDEDIEDIGVTSTAQDIRLPAGFTLDAPQPVAPTQNRKGDFGGAPVAPVMPDERSIDRDTGASMEARTFVGSARTPEDRLTQVRKYYPDAQPYGSDNFVFTDPKTKRPTLYNEEGWLPSAGDIASLTPEMYEVGGGILGGALATPPAVMGAVPTGGLSFGAIPLGIGLGAAAGREVHGNVAHAQGVPDSRSLPERFTDVAMTTGINAAGGMAGDVLGQGIRRGIGGVKSMLGGRTAQQQSLRDFEQAGVRPTPGAVTGNRGWQIIEQGLSNTPGGARVMQEVARSQKSDAARGIDDITRGLGGARSEQGAGEVIRDASGRAVQRFERRQEGLYDNAYQQIGASRQVSTPNTRRLLGEISMERAEAMGARDDVLTPIIERTKRVADAGDKGIGFEALRRLRTDIGKMLKTPPMGMTEGAQADKLRALYGTLSQDIEDAARKAGPQALKSLQVADRYTRFNLNINQKLWDKLARFDADEQAYRFATAEAGKGGTRLQRLRSNFTPDEWKVVSATVLDRLGQAVPSARGSAELGGEAGDFSASTFMTNWSKLAPEARDVLFGGKDFAEVSEGLDRLVRVIGQIKETDRMANPSGTARNLLIGSGLGVAGMQAMSGELVMAMTTIGMGTVAPYITAKMLTTPAFTKWLAGTIALGRQAPSSIPSLSGRLTVIAGAHPDLRDDVLRFQQALVDSRPGR